LHGLLEEWLAACGCTVAPHERYDVIVVDIPFPRQDGLDVVTGLAREHPGTPIIALSANFLPGVQACGSVARELGVGAVLPKPVTRSSLIDAIEQVRKR
jgi:CheY-like chemotaxis protein